MSIAAQASKLKAAPAVEDAAAIFANLYRRWTGDACPPLFWKQVRPCSYVFGRTITGFSFGTDARKRLLALEIMLDDEGWLRVSGSGIDCSGAMPRRISGYRTNAGDIHSRAL